ncbi:MULTISPECIES: arylesterase [Rhodonellum]|uniref:Acyl-CoA thioesterase-1 n=1 Tax=Rhodonellum ikkaensis TaxID=336829 RepID=A0A1H3KMD7_9BACT|nr:MULTISPECIES: arylesterase [Rhodonellum]SDY52878.1 acyl-CoA thioesterase-1 [Rhodonellum ikkaensis]
MKLNSLILLCVLTLSIFSCAPKDEKVVQSENLEQQETKTEKKLILFFGNSLTAGYGIEAEDAFPGLVASRIDSLGLDYRIINGGLSGETTASGVARLEWFLEEEPDIFILELGGNDGLRGIAISETEKNLRAMIQMVKAKYPKTRILLAGMQIPPNMGQDYASGFRELYPRVSQEENVTLIPFLLEGVAGNPALNLPDGIHPTEEGHLIVFETIWEFLAPLI